MKTPWQWSLLLLWVIANNVALAADPTALGTGAPLAPADPRVVAWIDPGKPLDSYPKNRLSLLRSI